MKKISMKKLGIHGQFGNQIIQYAFIRTYAMRCGLDYRLAKWCGQYLFGHEDPPIDEKLPDWHESREPAQPDAIYGKPIPPVGDECAGRDVHGWFQYHTSWYAPDKPFIQSLFVPVSPARQRVVDTMARLRERGRTVVSIHLRRGDSGRLIFFFTPVVWCLKWLHQNWERFDEPVLFLATEDSSWAKYFHHYRPVLAEDLGIDYVHEAPDHYIYPYGRNYTDPRQLDFFPDWYVLQNSDVVVASDSTFSVSAAWTSTTIKEFWRPRLSLRGFEQCDPWDMDVVTREHLDNFPGIPGTQLDENSRFWGAWRPKHPSVPETVEEIARWEVPSGEKK